MKTNVYIFNFFSGERVNSFMQTLSQNSMQNAITINIEITYIYYPNPAKSTDPWKEQKFWEDKIMR